MATIFANLPAHEGETGLTLYLYNMTTGTVINPGGDALTEIANGTFSAEVAEPLDQTLRADVEDSSNDVIASDTLWHGESVIGLMPDECVTSDYYNTVRRNAADVRPIYFQWDNDTATINGMVSVNGAPYVATSGAISFVRQESASYLWQIAHNTNDRPEEGTASFLVTDGVHTRIIPMTVDIGGDSGGGASPSTGLTYIVGYMPDRPTGTDITMYQDENIEISVTPRNARGQTEDLSTKLLYVVIDSEDTGVDAVVIDNNDLTKLPDSISFTVGTAVTGILTPSWRWALRDQTTDEVYIHGTIFVEPAATKDN